MLQTMEQALAQLWLEDHDLAYAASEYLDELHDERFPTQRV